VREVERCAVGDDTRALSGGEHSGWSCWSQTRCYACGAGGGVVDPQYGGTVAHAASVLSELQDSSSPVSAVVQKRRASQYSDRSCQCAS
jgi:hypothetical protein